jgi:hypothetical protein
MNSVTTAGRLHCWFWLLAIWYTYNVIEDGRGAARWHSLAGERHKNALPTRAAVAAAPAAAARRQAAGMDGWVPQLPQLPLSNMLVLAVCVGVWLLENWTNVSEDVVLVLLDTAGIVLTLPYITRIVASETASTTGHV